MATSIALAAAPRPVPLSLRVQVLLGGVLPVLGWIFLGVGLAIASMLLRFSEPVFGDPFAGPLVNLEGTVVQVEPTKARVDGDRVQAVHFEYRAGDRPRGGVSYTTGAVPEVGATVRIETVRGHPDQARIHGMSTAMLPSLVWLVLLFPAIGAGFLLAGVVLGRRRVRLLRLGDLARGRLVDSQPTNTTINNQRVHRMTFRFVDTAGQERTGVVRTHRLQNVSDGAEEALLYDPTGPSILLWDLLPPPELDRDGHLLPVGIGRLVPVLLPPTIVVVVLSLLDHIV